MRINLFLPLLLANYKSAPSSSSSSAPNLLDQKCQWYDVNKQLTEQSVRKWAEEWQEKGDGYDTPHFYHGAVAKLEAAEKGNSVTCLLYTSDAADE